MGVEEDILELRKAIRGLGPCTKALDAVVKAMTASPKDPAKVVEAARKAMEGVKAMEGIEAKARSAMASLEGALAAAREEVERGRALLAGQVASRLMEAHIPVRGNLPLLQAGAFTLEFIFGGKGQCILWFGPKKEKLATCPPSADEVVQKTIEMDRAIFAGPFDDAGFLASLWAAYQVACLRAGLQVGSRVRLTALLAEVAFLKQEEGFLADPRRELFRSYGRVQFAADLARLTTRRIGDRELRLDVATMSQTKRAVDHIWVPRGKSGDGTNFASAYFARVE